MAYTPFEWKNREVESPRTFVIQDNEDGTITLEPAEGHIEEPGTPIIAVHLNHMEQGIANAIPKDEKGKPNGVPSLDGSGKVPSSQLNVTQPPAASTSVPGIVQLNNSLSSTSTTQAATPNAVKQLNDDKASKSYEGWTKATLLNGWTGNLYYRKDSLGIVHLASDGIVGGPQATTAKGTLFATFPTSHMPNMSGITYPVFVTDFNNPFKDPVMASFYVSPPYLVLGIDIHPYNMFNTSWVSTAP